MTRSRVFAGLVIVGVVALVAYIGSNTYWEDVPIPTPPKGEAVTNPFYAAQRFAEALGARTKRERSVTLPPANAIVVLSAWHWDLTEQRREAIEQWVEGGGRLVVDDLLTGDLTPFTDWSGVEWDFNEAASKAHLENHDDHTTHPDCTPVAEVASGAAAFYGICGLDFTFLKTSGPVQWALQDDAGNQAVRVPVGKGSVTVINAQPFTWRSFLRSDHARLFVAATQLKRDDEVVFLTENDYPALLTLLWRYGAPAVALFLIALVLFLWRGSVRFGPAVALPEPRRRSMAEQIRGSGRFVLTHGDGLPLHAASVRALTEAARRRIPAYSRLSRPQRAAALAKATGLDGAAIISAIDAVGKRRPHELPNTLGLLEMARRQLLNSGTRAGQRT
jgi:hypothetical protein